MRNHLALSLAGLLLVAPAVSHASSSKPTIILTSPEKGAVYSLPGTTPISWKTKGVEHDVVALTTIELVKRDTSLPNEGYISGATYQHIVSANETDGGFTHEWSSNDVPGKYSIRTELHECNRKGCDIAPAGKRISKKSKSVQIKVTDTESPVTNSEGDSTITVIKPNGGERYVSGKGRLTVSWEAADVPLKSKVCITLERQGGAGGVFAFPGNSSCKKAREGKGSVKGSLERTVGYDLAPGDYWARVRLVAPSTRDGKDGEILAQDLSDTVFTLR